MLQGNRYPRHGRVLVPVLAIVIAAFTAEARAHERNVNRSVYVPVLFETCDHLKEVRLTVSGEERPFPPGVRIFQFTYYADKKVVLPDLVEVRIDGKGVGEDLADIHTNVLITPESIVASSDSLNRSQEHIRKLLRIRQDARLREARVLIKCTDRCPFRTGPSSRVGDSEGGSR